MKFIEYELFSAELTRRRSTARRLFTATHPAGFSFVAHGIASLAAVATLGKQEMNDTMPGEPPVRLLRRAGTCAAA
ncbi:hypothetical protein [Bradyrhizobium yuanmingense]|uniref:hypothetical protein n=1 Tax=Bradyrhizobium yuanmingense TaxID=108015 RepID=UPI0023B90734|nr:hypothetical protein [Bradyrhizobium yuanmingense]MDF0499029.1 hypothetical protein [Bradyrhizobium yuanmingense]